MENRHISIYSHCQFHCCSDRRRCCRAVVSWKTVAHRRKSPKRQPHTAHCTQCSWPACRYRFTLSLLRSHTFSGVWRFTFLRWPHTGRHHSPYAFCHLFSRLFPLQKFFHSFHSFNFFVAADAVVVSPTPSNSSIAHSDATVISGRFSGRVCCKTCK